MNIRNGNEEESLDHAAAVGKVHDGKSPVQVGNEDESLSAEDLAWFRCEDVGEEDQGSKEPFDCLKWLREVRDQIYEETKHMTTQERIAWRRARRPKEGILAEMWAHLDSPKNKKWNRRNCLPPDPEIGERARAESRKFDGA